MGIYDILPEGSQVKCWDCELVHLETGYFVGKLNRRSEYIVLLREGGYIYVKCEMIEEIVEEKNFELPSKYRDLPMFDKWGNKTHYLTIHLHNQSS